MRIHMDRKGQMILLDAMVFFLILSAAALLPSVLERTGEQADDVDQYSRLQEETQNTLQVLLESTLPQIDFCWEGGNKTFQHMQIGLGIQMEAQGLANDTPRTFYAGFEENVTKAVFQSLAIGNRARLEVKWGEGGNYTLGAELPVNRDIAVASQKYEGTGVEIRMLVWII